MAVGPTCLLYNVRRDTKAFAVHRTGKIHESFVPRSTCYCDFVNERHAKPNEVFHKTGVKLLLVHQESLKSVRGLDAERR